MSEGGFCVDDFPLVAEHWEEVQLLDGQGERLGPMAPAKRRGEVEVIDGKSGARVRQVRWHFAKQALWREPGISMRIAAGTGEVWRIDKVEWRRRGERIVCTATRLAPGRMDEGVLLLRGKPVRQGDGTLVYSWMRAAHCSPGALSRDASGETRLAVESSRGLDELLRTGPLDAWRVRDAQGDVYDVEKWLHISGRWTGVLQELCKKSCAGSLPSCGREMG